MSTSALVRGTLHPEVEKVLTLFEELRVPEFYKQTPEQARALFSGLRPDKDLLPAIHNREQLQIPVMDGNIDLRIYRPDDRENLPALMWFHGGGWVFGDLESGELACREIASQAECIVVSVDYRLAPEFRFPTALQDCIAATQWVLDNAKKLSIDSTRFAVGGDSAGGNLAAAVAQYARDEKIDLTHQVLVYPITQPDFDTPSYVANAEGYFLSRESMMWFWDHYVPDTTMREDPRVSPLLGNLNGLAPAWVLTCGFDPLCDDGIRYIEALSEVSVEVVGYHRDDAIHGVFGMAIDVGQEIRSIAARALHQSFEVKT